MAVSWHPILNVDNSDNRPFAPASGSSATEAFDQQNRDYGTIQSPILASAVGTLTYLLDSSEAD